MSFPKRQTVLLLKPEEVLPFEPHRLHERAVRFDSKTGPAFAVEASIPLTELIRKYVAKEVKLIIPPNITTLTYFDLSPQQSMFPVKFRTVQTSFESKDRNDPYYLYQLRVACAGYPRGTESLQKREMQKAGVFADLLGGVFNHHQEEKDYFSSLLFQAAGNDLVIAVGHGGKNPHRMGEEYDDSVVRNGSIVQRRANNVPTSAVLQHFNQPEMYAGIVLHTCNVEKANIRVKNVALAYLEGITNQGAYEPPLGEPIVKAPHSD